MGLEISRLRRSAARGVVCAGLVLFGAAASGQAAAPPLPDSPGSLLARPGAGHPGAGGLLDTLDSDPQNAGSLPPCPDPDGGVAVGDPLPARSHAPCVATQAALRSVVNSDQRRILSARQKGTLALRGVVDPFNLLFISFESGIGIAANAHSAYGPGMRGFGRLTGYSVLQDTQGEFFGTFLIPALTREDPRYRRMQNAPVGRRILHALSRTVIAEHDGGGAMLNYAVLLTYPISAELSNLYVPGVHDNGPSTARRIVLGYATDPVGNIIAEFLPDLARRVHVRSIFVQQIINQMALGTNLQ